MQVSKPFYLPCSSCVFNLSNVVKIEMNGEFVCKQVVVLVLSVSEKCRFCTGTGTVVVELGGDEKEVSNCINCDGVGSFTCTTCQGSGIQPRYLDRRY